MTSPQISVIIPVFNKEKYLSQCLESVIGQTFSDMEIICVNDGSTDHSPEIFRGRRNLQPETYKQIKELVSRGWYTCRFRCLAVTAGQSAAGRAIGLGFDFIKAYLLFPWYVYKIYKTLIKK